MYLSKMCIEFLYNLLMIDHCLHFDQWTLSSRCHTSNSSHFWIDNWWFMCTVEKSANMFMLNGVVCPVWNTDIIRETDPWSMGIEKSITPEVADIPQISRPFPLKANHLLYGHQTWNDISQLHCCINRSWQMRIMTVSVADDLLISMEYCWSLWQIKSTL